jgi:uncharacterized protein (TIGR03437 family)
MKFILIGVVLAGIAAAQTPTITNGGVTNAASYAIPDLPSGALAKGSLIVIKGNNLGPDKAPTFSSYPLPLQQDGTSVKATVNGTSVDAYMMYTSKAQVAAILPSRTPSGNGTLTVTYNGQTSAPASIRVVDSAFGIFTLNQAGSGPGIFQNAYSSTDLRVNTLTESARPGQTVVIWGTGLGPVTQNEAAGPAPGDLPINLQVYVGGKAANVAYKGRSGCCVTDQVAFIVPDGVEGCYVPVVVKINDVVSNFVTMSVARNNGVCTDPNGISGTQLESAQRSGTFRNGGVTLTRSVSKFSFPGLGSIESKSDNGSAAFQRYTFDELIRTQGIGGGFATTYGSCTVFNSSSASGTIGDTVIKPVQLDAGPVININGPKGPKQLTKENGVYTAQLGGGAPSIPGIPGGAAAPDYLEPGSYTIDNGSGGSGPDAVGAFRVNLTIPQLLNWTNMDATETVTRANGLNITWSGGDPNGSVYMIGTSSLGNSAAVFVCSERTNAGQFTVPSYVLAALPATTGQNVGILSVTNNTQPVTFTAAGLDIGAVVAASGSTKTVTYR